MKQPIRHQLMDLECAEEGAWQPHEPKQAPRVPRDTKASAWIGPALAAGVLVAVAIGSAIYEVFFA